MLQIDVRADGGKCKRGLMVREGIMAKCKRPRYAYISQGHGPTNSTACQELAVVFINTDAGVTSAYMSTRSEDAPKHAKITLG